MKLYSILIISIALLIISFSDSVNCKIITKYDIYIKELQTPFALSINDENIKIKEISEIKYLEKGVVEVMILSPTSEILLRKLIMTGTNSNSYINSVSISCIMFIIVCPLVLLFSAALIHKGYKL